MTSEQYSRLWRDIENAIATPVWVTWLLYLAFFLAGFGAGVLFVLGGTNE